MKTTLIVAACALALPGITLAATRNYDTDAFESVSVSAGVDADITMGSTRSVAAETTSADFDDLTISVENKVLHIGRPVVRNWLSGKRPEYKVHIVTPALRSLDVSSGAHAKAKGPLQGDFKVSTSSGSSADLSQIKAGDVRSSSSSGSHIDIAGTCTSLDVDTSSGSSVDAGDLSCEKVTVHMSSGSQASVAATQRVAGRASSGSTLRIKGKPAVVDVDKSSGASVSVRD